MLGAIRRGQQWSAGCNEYESSVFVLANIVFAVVVPHFPIAIMVSIVVVVVRTYLFGVASRRHSRRRRRRRRRRTYHGGGGPNTVRT